MSLQHKNIVRMQEEYLCTFCGKSWDVNDAEPPACSEDQVEATVRTVERRTWRSAAVPSLQNLPKTGHGMPVANEYKATGYAYDPPADPAFLDYMLHDLKNSQPLVPVAYLIFIDGGYGTIIYGDSITNTIQFFERTMGHMLTMEQLYSIGIQRFTAMDVYCTGRSPRVEMNPSVMAEASTRATNAGQQFNVVNITTFVAKLKGQK